MKSLETKILGVWLSQDVKWSRQCKEICIKAYSRLSMITKLKYVGIGTQDLVDIYTHFIRSVIEYCSVVYHSRLTIEQSNTLERIQKVCLKVILADSYVSYESALQLTSLEKLSIRREQRCLDFSLKCIKHPTNKRLFPPNILKDGKTKEMFVVNWARTDAYKDSTIPYCQRLLNYYFSTK